MSDFKLDASLLDVLELDGVSSTPTPPSDEIYYNLFGLQNANVVTQSLKVSSANYDLQDRQLPRADGEYAESAQYRKTSIKIKGFLKSDTRTNLETLMDTMRKYLRQGNATLKCQWAGATRYYDNCHPVGIDSLFDGRESFHITFCPFEIEFVSLQPYGRNSDRIVLDSPFAITASPTLFIANNAGTAPSNTLIFLTLVTVGTLSQIVIENVTNGDKMTISGSFSNGDLLTIDGENIVVSKNGVAIDYSGVIPVINPGDNTIKLTITGASYSLSLTEQHYSRYH